MTKKIEIIGINDTKYSTEDEDFKITNIIEHDFHTVFTVYDSKLDSTFELRTESTKPLDGTTTAHRERIYNQCWILSH